MRNLYYKGATFVIKTFGNAGSFAMDSILLEVILSQAISFLVLFHKGILNIFYMELDQTGT